MVGSARHLIEECPHHLLGILKQFGRCLPGSLQAVAATDFAQSLSPDMTGGDLSAQIALAFLRCTDVAQEQRKDIRLHFPRAHDFYRRNAESLLIDLATKTHRTRIGTPDVCVVGTRSDVKAGSLILRSQASAPDKHRSNQSNIRQMS